MSDNWQSRDMTATLLVIGPSQHGKSTFINKLGALSLTKSEPEAKMGDGNRSCTTKCSVYNFDLPLTTWSLVDSVSNRGIEIPDDEEKVFEEVWQRSRGNRMKIVPDDPQGPMMKLRLIDSPGLDDSEGRDAENIFNVLSCVNDLSKSADSYLSGIVFISSVQLAFTWSFQAIYKYYERCMPNLFGGVIIVNTNFTVSVWESRHNSHVDRLRSIASSGLKHRRYDSMKPETCRQRIIRERRETFTKMFGRDPLHFFIDSNPSQRMAFEEYTTRNTISDFLNAIRSQAPMPIKEMRLIKTVEQLAIDLKLVDMLRRAESRWERERTQYQSEASVRQRTIGIFERTVKTAEADIESYRGKVDLMDNNTEFALRTYTTEDEVGFMKRAWNFIVRSKIQSTMCINEEWNPFFVRTVDRENARWLDCVQDGKMWKGAYEGDPGVLPRLTARSYTYNRHVYAKQIKDLKEIMAQRYNHMEESLDELNRLQTESKSVAEPRVARLNTILVKAKIIREDLLSEEVPLDVGFGDAARFRYRLRPQDITEWHLHAMVAERHVDVANALQETLVIRDPSESHPNRS